MRRVASSLDSSSACVASRAGARLDLGPTLTQGFVEACRRELGVEWAVPLEPQRRSIGQHDPSICGHRPGRPPVDDHGAKASFRGHFPECLRATLAAARDRRTSSGGRDRSRHESRGRAARVARSRRCHGLRRGVAFRGPARHARQAAARSRRSSRPAPDHLRLPAATRAARAHRPGAAVRAGSRPLADSESKIRASKPSIAMTRTRRPVGTTVNCIARCRAAPRFRRPRQQQRRAGKRDCARRDGAAPGRLRAPAPVTLRSAISRQEHRRRGDDHGMPQQQTHRDRQRPALKSSRSAPTTRVRR